MPKKQEKTIKNMKTLELKEMSKIQALNFLRKHWNEPIFDLDKISRQNASKSDSEANLKGGQKKE